MSHSLDEVLLEFRLLLFYEVEGVLVHVSTGDTVLHDRQKLDL